MHFQLIKVELDVINVQHVLMKQDSKQVIIWKVLLI